MEADSIWKEMLELLFKEFLHFFFPDIHHDIDFAKGYLFLDKEFQKISQDSKSGRKIVDKLVKVFLKSGQEKWLLIHIEIQGQKTKDFAQRMYTYNYRIFDKFQRNIVSLALLTDTNPNYRPNVFKFEQWNFSLNFKFPLAKIIDYIDYDFEKEYRKNPFSILMQAYLKTMETQGDNFKRYQWKKKFVATLYQLGFAHKTLYNLFRFIEWMMELPDELENKLYQEVNEMKGEQAMSFIIFPEKKWREEGVKEGLKQGIKQGIQKGIQKGIQEGELKGFIRGRQEAIQVALEIKFQNVDKKILDMIKKVKSLDALEYLLEQAKLIKDLESFKKVLKEKINREQE